LDDQKFKAQYGFPKPSKDQKIIFYCQAGSRSQTACELASAMGYENVFNYEGSWSEWSSS
jgi:rhodanese-related sulfurtransferase